jgi:REP-associated tyrosine transposase
MPRGPRDVEPGLFHVYAHAVWAADALFRDDEDRLTFLRELALATSRVGWTCVGYCLMTTHYHLVLDVANDMLPKGMHSLSFRYASSFNARHAMKGHVHGRRYGARRLTSEADLLGAFKYVARNPVEAMLCERPEQWHWSSYAATIGLATQHSFVDPRLVLSCFEDPLEFARAGLRRFVEES